MEPAAGSSVQPAWCDSPPDAAPTAASLSARAGLVVGIVAGVALGRPSINPGPRRPDRGRRRLRRPVPRRPSDARDGAHRGRSAGAGGGRGRRRRHDRHVVGAGEVPGGSDKEVVIVSSAFVGVRADGVDVRLVGAGEPIVIEAELEPSTSSRSSGSSPATPADLPAPLPFARGPGPRFAALSAELTSPSPRRHRSPRHHRRRTRRARPPRRLGSGPGARLDRPGRPPRGRQPRRARRSPASPTSGNRATGRGSPPGLGEVRASAGRAAAGSVERRGRADPHRVAGRPAELQGRHGHGHAVETIGDSLARDAGLDALDLPWLLAFLAVYVALVGPIGYLVLRRRRQPGLDRHPGRGCALHRRGVDHRLGPRAARPRRRTVLERAPPGASGHHRPRPRVADRRRRCGRFPAGWTAGAVDNNFFGRAASHGGQPSSPSTPARRHRRHHPRRRRIRVLRGSGPVDAEGGLVVGHGEADGTSAAPSATTRLAVESRRRDPRPRRRGAGNDRARREVEFRFEGVEVGRSATRTSPPRARCGRTSPASSATPVRHAVNLALWNDAHRPRPERPDPAAWSPSSAGPGRRHPGRRPRRRVAGGRSAVVGRATVATDPTGRSPLQRHRGCP